MSVARKVAAKRAFCPIRIAAPAATKATPMRHTQSGRPKYHGGPNPATERAQKKGRIAESTKTEAKKDRPSFGKGAAFSRSSKGAALARNPSPPHIPSATNTLAHAFP